MIWFFLKKQIKFPNIPLGTYHNIPPNQQFMKDFLSFAGLGTPWSLLQRQPPIFCRLPCLLSTPKQSTDQPTHKRGNQKITFLNHQALPQFIHAMGFTSWAPKKPVVSGVVTVESPLGPWGEITPGKPTASMINFQKYQFSKDPYP